MLDNYVISVVKETKYPKYKKTYERITKPFKKYKISFQPRDTAFTNLKLNFDVKLDSSIIQLTELMNVIGFGGTDQEIDRFDCNFISVYNI